MTNGKRIWRIIKKSLPVKRKYNVCFMPYKAEMWDSLKSIYDACMEDKRVKVTVKWLAYSLKERGRLTYRRVEQVKGIPDEVIMDATVAYPKFDVIFIHNIYDDENGVTEVIAKTSQIRHFTDRLVYVPYFVMDETPDNFIKKKGMYSVTDVVVDNAEEKARYKKAFYSMGISPDLIVCQSPKYDFVKEPVEIPEAWLPKLRRENILVNAHLSRAYSNKNSISDIKTRLETYANDPLVCIIFRPHPLMVETIKSLGKPEKLAEWNELREWILSIDNFIYDATSDYRYAFQASDWMLTDASSLTLLYDKRQEKL